MSAVRRRSLRLTLSSLGPFLHLCRGPEGGRGSWVEPQLASSPGQAAPAVDTGHSERLSTEPYLIANPAFEAYLDSSSTDPDSRESDACTTPRSAIMSQVCPTSQPMPRSLASSQEGENQQRDAAQWQLIA